MQQIRTDLNAAQFQGPEREKAEQLYREHTAACAKLGIHPDSFAAFLQDVINSPAGIFDEEPVLKQPVEPSRHYYQYTAPRTNQETA